MIVEAIIRLLQQELNQIPGDNFLKVCNQNDIKAVCDILVKNDFKDNLEELKTKVKKLIERRNAEVSNLENDAVKQFIYKTIRMIFENTDQEERFLYLEDILNKSYDLLVQKLINLKKLQDIISRKDYNIAVRKFIPFVKLDKILETNSSIKNKANIDEFLEYLLQPDILREDTYTIIKNKFDKQNFKYLGYELKLIKERLGFNGNYAKLKIFTKHKEDVVSNFFIKLIPKEHDEATKKMAENSFIKEETFYLKFIDSFEKITNEETKFLPKCYFVSENFIVLEDVSFLEYSQVKILTNLEYDHCALAIKKLAKLHSVTIIIEEKLSENLGRKVTIDNYLPEMITETQILEIPFNLVSIELAVHYLTKFPKLVKDVTIQEFQKRATKNFLEIFKKVNKSERFRNVVNHGDIWWSNILYKWDQHKRPTECLLLDFQLLRYVPPVYDILMLLHITIDRDTRQKHTKTLLDVYYNELKSILDKNDIDIKNILPYNDLFKSLEELRILGIYLATLYHLVNGLPSKQYNNVFSNFKLATRFWNEFDVRCRIFDEVWDEMKQDKRFEENAMDLYEYCLKNV